MCTKKDYIRAAEIVRSCGSGELRAHLCESYVFFFQRDNARFDVERFRAACEPTTKK